MVNPHAHIDILNFTVIPYMNHRVIDHRHKVGGPRLSIGNRNKILLKERIRIILQQHRRIGGRNPLVIAQVKAVDKLNLQLEIHIHRVRVIDPQPVAPRFQRRHILPRNGHSAARR